MNRLTESDADSLTEDDIRAIYDEIEARFGSPCARENLVKSTTRQQFGHQIDASHGVLVPDSAMTHVRAFVSNGTDCEQVQLSFKLLILAVL